MIGERSAAYAGYRTRELFVDGAGPKLVLVHGFGHPAPCWRPILERCALLGQAAVAVDLPGFGVADPLAAGPRLPQLVRFLEAVVTAQGAVTPVVLVGNSLGATAAVRLLDTIPDLPVRGLVALDTATDQWTMLARTAMRGRGRPLAGLSRLWLPRGLFGFGAGVVAAHLLYGDSRRADPALVALLADQLTSRRVRRDMAMLARHLVSEVAVVATARNLNCRTIFVHGARDRLVTVAASANLHAAIPDSRLVVLEGIGHCPHLDAPDQVLELALGLAGGASGRRTETA